jgi:hypothetical protein
MIRKSINRVLPKEFCFRLKRVLYGLPPICPQIRAWAESTGQAEIVKVYWNTYQRSRPLPSVSEG